MMNYAKRTALPDVSFRATAGREVVGPFDDISDEESLRRAVHTAGRQSKMGDPVWVAVMDRFALGSTYARALCKRFDVDPEFVPKPRRGK